MNKNRVFFTIMTIWLAIMSCNLPGGQAAQGTPTGFSAEELAGTITAPASTTQTAAATFTPSAPITGTITVTISPTLCSPSATANTSANIRSGPGTVYPSIDAITAGTSVAVAGKNVEGTW